MTKLERTLIVVIALIIVITLALLVSAHMGPIPIPQMGGIQAPSF